jgi:hypothetical protein
VFLGESPFRIGQFHVPHRNAQAPVVTDRAALHPGYDQVQFLELDARDPDSSEEVSLTAPHDGIDAEVIAETPPDEGCARDNTGNDQNGFDGSPQHSVIMSPR